LLLSEKFYLSIAQRLSHTSIEADRLLCALLPNAPASVKDGGLEQHLECVVQKDQAATQSPPFVRSIEKFNAQDQRVAGFLKEELCLAPHEFKRLRNGKSNRQRSMDGQF
jgi:hypothetical protein